MTPLLQELKNEGAENRTARSENLAKLLEKMEEERFSFKPMKIEIEKLKELVQGEIKMVEEEAFKIESENFLKTKEDMENRFMKYLKKKSGSNITVK
jgi:hypothetical protein